MMMREDQGKEGGLLGLLVLSGQLTGFIEGATTCAGGGGVGESDRAGDAVVACLGDGIASIGVVGFALWAERIYQLLPLPCETSIVGCLYLPLQFPSVFSYLDLAVPSPPSSASLPPCRPPCP